MSSARAGVSGTEVAKTEIVTPRIFAKGESVTRNRERKKKKQKGKIKRKAE
jgi:hypothetical protein